MKPADDSNPFDVGIWIDENNFVHADLIEEFKIGPITYRETTENIFDIVPELVFPDAYDWAGDWRWED